MRRAKRAATLRKLFIVTLNLAAAVAACEPGGETIDIAQSSAPLTCRGCSDLYIVAHEDDDLLFMNPDIRNSILAGNTVRTTFVTAGDASSPSSYWLSREAGILAAYASAAGASNNWTPGPEIIGGRLLQVRRLIGTNVSVIFLRLPDPVNADPGLEELWNGSASTLTSRDSANTYTREQLIDILHQIMNASVAERIGTLDSTGNHLNDHSDHIHSALFAYAAHERYSPVHALSIYRGYSIESYQENLHYDEYSPKRSIFLTYAAHDPYIGGLTACPAGGQDIYCTWIQRQYPFSSDYDGAGNIGITDGRCLAIDSGSPYTNAVLRLDNCAVGGAFRFNLTNQSIQYGGYCVTAAGTTPTLTPCNSSAQQKFTMTNNGQIRGPNATCLEQSGSGALVVTTCPSTQVLNWTRQPRFTNYHSVTNEFGNNEGTAPWYAQTFRLGDLNGDGRADACMRKTDGVYCALAGASGFANYSRWTTEFSDALGWAIDYHGTTIQLGDINGDGLADVCGRGGAGIICATSNSASFVGPSLRSTSFSNGAGWAAYPAYYRSVRLADVNGDGRADVCGRGGAGIYCVLANTVGSFGAEALWTTAFDDGSGWLGDNYGTTIQFGDITGDGRADVCGRGIGAVHCAVSNGAGFINMHPWTFQSEYSDAYGWNFETFAQSMRLGDIDGDGGADLCARGTAGIWCATTNGTNSFSPSRLFMPRDFTDAYGWTPAYHGATLALGDLDGDGRADICGRGGVRLICAIP